MPAGNLHTGLRYDEFCRKRLCHDQYPGDVENHGQKSAGTRVRPELEVFDTGHLVLAKEMIRQGLIDDPVMIQLCMGIPYGAPDDPTTLMSMVHALPEGATFSAFSIGRKELPYVAMAVLAGGNVRVGLEDNLYLEKGVLASNAQLVERAVTILDAMNVNILGPDEVRNNLKLRKRG